MIGRVCVQNALSGVRKRNRYAHFPAYAVASAGGTAFAASVRRATHRASPFRTLSTVCQTGGAAGLLRVHASISLSDLGSGAA